MKYFEPGSLPRGAKCSRCGRQAEFQLPSHHANFCPECFRLFCRNAVQRAMKLFQLSKKKPILVAVSGGKDSLALWALLNELGYQTHGLHINLGLGDFSSASLKAVEEFASSRGLSWSYYNLKDLIGYSILDIKKYTRRKICSICGRIKRQFLNRLAIKEGHTIVATGHNLDDEAARLLGNLIRHKNEYLAKSYPFLPSIHPRFPAKIKPLHRLEEKEIIMYCYLENIQPTSINCPLSQGATSTIFKEALEFLEQRMPGTKRDFLFTYIKNRKPPRESEDLGECKKCGEPCYGDLCSICNLLVQLRVSN